MERVEQMTTAKTSNDYFNLANQLKQSRDWDAAIAAYQKAIELRPNFAWYHHNLAETWVQLDAVDEAIACYRCACELNPHSEWSFFNLGKLLARCNKTEEAITAFQQAIKISPETGEFQSQLGQMLQQMNRLDEAQQFYHKAIELNPESVVAYQQLWQILKSQGQISEAFSYLEQAISLDPANGELYFQQAEEFLGQQNYEAAIETFHKATQLNPNHAQAYLKLGVAYGNTGKVNEAIAAYRQAVDLDPTLATAYHFLGHALSTQNRWEEAIACYQKTIELVPQAASVYQHWGEALAAQEQWKEAVEKYYQSIEIDPNCAAAQHQLGIALAQVQRYDEAVDCYLKALQLCPDSQSIKLDLAQALVHQDLLDAEIADYLQLKSAQGSEIYDLWRKANEPRTADLRQMRQTVEIFGYKPLISVIMPTYNTPEWFLREAIDSVLEQVYPHWELCIADDASPAPHVKQILDQYCAKDSRIKVVYRQQNGHISAASNSALELATGEFIALLDHDDLLTPDALYEVVLLLNRHPEADMIYSDEDKVNEKGKLIGPFFKPDWSPDSFFSRMYTCHLGVYRRELINQISGFRLGYEGSQDYDLVLRFTEKTDRIFHLPKILYHWRMHPGSAAGGAQAKPYAYEAGKRALQDAINRRGESGKVEAVPGFLGNFIVRYNIFDYKLVSIIIPTKDLGETLDKCLESIFTKSLYPHYEVILIDNGSVEEYTNNVIEKWSIQEADRFRSYRLDIPFNFSTLNNYAVNQAKGDYLLFLNNDTEVISPDWIDAMVEQAQRASIGAVGSLLLYSDNTIQHAGVILGVGGIANHSHRGFSSVDPGYFSYIKCLNNVSAVTGACLMCRREVFEEIGGFDETLAVAYNDVDLCLKMLNLGYKNIYLPHVILYHHESKSRGYEDTPKKQKRLRQEIEIITHRWQKFINNDPYYNPHLSKTKCDYSINLPFPEVTIDTVVLAKIDPEILWGWYLDEPKAKSQVYANAMVIRGWVIGKKAPAVAVEILYEGRVFRKVVVNQVRPDVADSYPDLSEVKTSGFRVSIGILGMSPAKELKIQTVLKDNTRILLGIIKLGSSLALEASS